MYSTQTTKGNLSNEFQGEHKKVLCVCSAGLLRSPTIAHTLCSKPYNYNTRSAGTERSYALNLVTEDLLLWADEIVCADTEHVMRVKDMLFVLGYDLSKLKKRVICLEIPDIYDYRAPKLVKRIKDTYNRILAEQGEEK